MNEQMEKEGWALEGVMLAKTKTVCWKCKGSWEGSLELIRHKIYGGRQAFDPGTCPLCGAKWSEKRPKGGIL